MDKNKTFAQIEQEYDQMAQTIKDMQRTAVRPVMTGCVRRFSVPCGVFGTPIVKHLNDWSWQDISEIAASGLAPAFFQVGDIKTVTLKDGSTIELRIIGFNHDQDPDGRILPISFETVQTLNKDFSMNEDWTNVGGWAESKLRRVLNSEVLNLLPDDLLAVIKPCVKVTSKGGKDQDGTMTQTTDKLFILSEQEIFGRKIYSIGGEGQWYAVTDKAYAALIELCADICRRNGIKRLLWKGDKNLVGKVEQQNMTVHRWFAAKACPGDYLYERHGDIAAKVNAKLTVAENGPEEVPVKIYHTLPDVPDSYRPTIQKLMEKKALCGYSDPDPTRLDDNIIDVDEVYCRVMTTLDRLGVLG